MPIVPMLLCKAKNVLGIRTREHAFTDAKEFTIASPFQMYTRFQCWHVMWLSLFTSLIIITSGTSFLPPLVSFSFRQVVLPTNRRASCDRTTIQSGNNEKNHRGRIGMPAIWNGPMMVRPQVLLQLTSSKDESEKSSFAGEQEKEKERTQKTSFEIEWDELQERLSLMEALEARNEAQLDSFVDAQDQWDSLEPEERELLESKPQVEARMEVLAEQLVQLWMGQKSLDG